jgi:hypothetical protein
MSWVTARASRAYTRCVYQRNGRSSSRGDNNDLDGTPASIRILPAIAAAAGC